MFKQLTLIPFCLILSGCLSPEIKDNNLESLVKAQVETEVTGLKADIKSEITGIKASLQSEITTDIKATLTNEITADVKTTLTNEIKTDIKSHFNNEMKAKMNVLGGDIQGKIDKLNAKFDTQIETHTQNTGMFSGGGIYVMGVAIALIAAVFGTIIWLLKKLMHWKRIWHVVSEVIENHEEEDKENAAKIKNKIAALSRAAGVHDIIDRNLKSRGFKKKS
jgi:hypothetical protein